MDDRISASASAGSSEDAPRISRVRNRSNAPCALLAWMVASAPRWPVFIAVQKRPRLGPTDFADDDAVGTMAKRGLEQVVEADRLPVGIGWASCGDHMRLADM